MKYRKKPVVIEATQWFNHGDHPAVLKPPKGEDVSDLWGWIYTLEGGYRVVPGDYIITGVKGEFYPVKEAIFLETYEKAEDAA